MVYSLANSYHDIRGRRISLYSAEERDHAVPAYLEIEEPEGGVVARLELGPVALRRLAGSLADLQAEVEHATTPDDWEGEEN